MKEDNPPTVYLSLGSNLGDPIALIHEAIEKIRSLPAVFSVKAASLYHTSPVDMDPSTPPFINTALSLTTHQNPWAFKEAMRNIETELGKEHRPPRSSRLIDIDILAFGTLWMDDPELTLPHPRWHERLFVLVPLSDLTETLTLPHPQPPHSPITFSLETLITSHSNPHQETIQKVGSALPLLSSQLCPLTPA